MRAHTPAVIRFAALFLCVFLAAALSAQELQHTVVKGDTLYSLSRSYGVSVDRIREANGMSPSSVLKAGQKLLIPGKASPTAVTKHTVAKGDTLYGLARSYGVSVDAIRSANGLSKDATLKIGQVLGIPGGKAPLVAASSSPAATRAPQASSVSWPLEGKRSALTGKLRGISIAGNAGAPIRSVSAGTVIHADLFKTYGQVVFVERKDKLIYAYAGMGELSVRLGDTVQSGAKLGELPAGSGESPPALSFMVFKGSRTLDPTTAPRD